MMLWAPNAVCSAPAGGRVHTCRCALRVPWSPNAVRWRTKKDAELGDGMSTVGTDAVCSTHTRHFCCAPYMAPQ